MKVEEKLELKIEKKQRYDDLFQLFLSGGWKEFVSARKQDIENMKIIALTEADTPEGHPISYYRGQLSVLMQIVTYEESIRADHGEFERDVKEGFFEEDDPEHLE